MRIRKGQAYCIVVFFVAFVSLSTWVPCPFLNADFSPHSSRPCCPQRTPQPQRCPFSKTLQACPFFVTDSKIGVIEAKLHPIDAVPTPVAGDIPIPGIVITVLREAEEPGLNQADTYLKNRVLRI